ncbi:regulatory Fis family protein [Roseiarcus fermentans]|uniref:Regulatory Fis family protein n=1 Tax=Roseiarcus fermentans TaxID=1473586 RepID=A0A366EL19_9HYPH|nr:sigma-54-dependent Fis family transcriptional regulator [Roseiarcus fermentans]RBP03058.1 regulatory Fis family protein [Roseiarcus fermentans]
MSKASRLDGPRGADAPPSSPTQGAAGGFFDLVGRLHFSTADGRIWLDDQRMLLLNARSLGRLRRDMIDTVGFETARGLMTRMGYFAGVTDARMARKVRANLSMRDMFLVGPNMHCLEGVGMTEPVKLEVDVERGVHHGEFIWTNPVEDEEHLRFFPIGPEPACWMQIGYASGFSTEFMGRPVLYREVECQSMGHAACRIVGKVVDDWGPEAAEELRLMMPESALEHSTDRKPPALAVLPGGAEGTQDGPVGVSPGFNATAQMVRRVAPTRATVLFLGESGVGKEVFARLLHRQSGRGERPFVAVNCATLPDQLVEAELFGVEKGAYTGAVASRAGRFERADGGTLFLDEIGTLNAAAQAKLLRALQEGEVERVGGAATLRVDVRVVAATNVDLRQAVRAGQFREDLFFRLNVFPVAIPPLRQRHEDIPALVAHFLAKFNARHGRRMEGFTQRAIDALLSYPWPGNVRELENVIERGVVLAPEGAPIDTPHLFTSGELVDDRRLSLNRDGRIAPAGAPASHPRDAGADEAARLASSVKTLLEAEEGSVEPFSLEHFETLLLRRAVDRAEGNLAAAARLLGITRAQLVYRLKSRDLGQAAAVGT